MALLNEVHLQIFKSDPETLDDLNRHADLRTVTIVLGTDAARFPSLARPFELVSLSTKEASICEGPLSYVYPLLELSEVEELIETFNQHMVKIHRPEDTKPPIKFGIAKIRSLD